MARQFERIEEQHKAFITAQPVFFVGTAGAAGRVNVSPKGMDSLVVDAPGRVIWRNLTGSGNESAGHLRQCNRMTLMWCSFGRRPMILRVFGTAQTLHPRDPAWAVLDGRFAPDPGARQIFDLAVDLVQTSCGYGVPLMSLAGDRGTLKKWAEDKGESGIRDTWSTRNRRTIDGFDTGILPDEG